MVCIWIFIQFMWPFQTLWFVMWLSNPSTKTITTVCCSNALKLPEDRILLSLPKKSVTSFLTFVLYPTKQVNYKVSLTAKNYALLFITRQSYWSRKISPAITRQITQEDINLFRTKTTSKSKPYSTTSYEHVSILTLGGL